MFYPSFDTYTSKITKEAKKGDILMSVRAPVGDLNFAPCNLCIGRGLSAIRAKDGDNDFLFYALKYNIQNLIKQSSGTTFDSVNKDVVNDMDMIIPEDKNSYSRISRLLRMLDDKIENNNKISAELEGLAKTIYDYWFLQFEFPNEEGKPYKSSGGKMIYNEELKREIPEGWKFDSLRNRYSIKRGISYTSKDIESGKGTPMLNLACIDIDRNYRDGEIKYINNDIKEEAILNPGEMLIATTDLTRNADIVGCPIIVPYDGEKYTYSMDLAKMVITDNALNKWYVYSALRTNHYHNYIKKWASGTNVLHLNLDGMNWYKTILPDKVIQDRYAEIIEPICKKQGSILRENRELASLRDWLLPMLMNGQITFKEMR